MIHLQKSVAWLCIGLVVFWDKANNEIEIPLLYLARDGSNVHIEFPYREEPTGSPAGGTS